MNGLELVQAIKSDYPLIPVLLMTAQGSEELAVEALRLGAASYVTKRRLGEDLISTIHQILEAASSNRGETRLLNRISSVETSYILPNETRLVHALSGQVRDTMRAMRIFPENDRLRISIAFEESLLNALYHGNLEVSSDLRYEDQTAYEDLARRRSLQEPYIDRQLYVDISLTQDAVRFSVRDEGSGFDPQTITDPTDPEYLDRPNGRGMLLMKSFMDELTYSESGRHVMMMKKSPPPETNIIDKDASVFDDDDSEDIL